MLRHPTLTLFDRGFATPAILALLISGCGSFNQPRTEVQNGTQIKQDEVQGFAPEVPHGTRIEHNEIPDAIRASIPDDASVERFGDDVSNAQYRVEHKDGTVIVIGP